MTLRCVNCSLRIARLWRHCLSEESDEILETVRRWVYPREVSGADYLCRACWELINRNHEQQPVPTRGHLKVCLTCGRSILRVKSRILLRDKMSEREIFVGSIISEWIHPRQLQPSDKICIPCWLKAQRAADSRLQKNPEVEASAGPSNLANVNEHIEIIVKVEPQHQDEPVHHENIEVEPVITLPTIRRAAATAEHCIFPECDDKEELYVPDSIRRQIMVDYKFYIPINSRICDYHLRSNSYHELYTADNAVSTFTAEHIEDIVFLTRKQNTIPC